jgi:hypothetical protein
MISSRKQLFLRRVFYYCVVFSSARFIYSIGVHLSTRMFYCKIEYLDGYTSLLTLDAVLECQRFGVQQSTSSSYDPTFLITESSERLFT